MVASRLPMSSATCWTATSFTNRHGHGQRVGSQATAPANTIWDIYVLLIWILAAKILKEQALLCSV